MVMFGNERSINVDWYQRVFSYFNFFHGSTNAHTYSLSVYEVKHRPEQRVLGWGTDM